MNRSVKKFGKQLGAFVLLLIIMDVVVGRLITPLYLSQKTGSAFKTVYAIEQAKEPLIILGSSRAYHHYNTEVLEKKLGMEGYNLGRDGAGILYNYAVYNTVCTRAIPKYLILDINMEEFEKPSVTYELLYQLLPHYRKNKYIREVVDLRSPFEFMKAQSALYCYNSQLFYMLAHHAKETDDTKGFLPLYGKLEEAPPIYHEPEKELDTLLISYFEKLIQQAKERKTQIFVFTSPTLDSYKKESKSVSKTREICAKYQLPYFVYVDDTTYTKHPEYFNDYSHLNIPGATMYSNMVADSILSLQKK